MHNYAPSPLQRLKSFKITRHNSTLVTKFITAYLWATNTNQLQFLVHLVYSISKLRFVIKTAISQNSDKKS